MPQDWTAGVEGQGTSTECTFCCYHEYLPTETEQKSDGSTHHSIYSSAKNTVEVQKFEAWKESQNYSKEYLLIAVTEGSSHQDSIV